jgi:hypothetical protein
VFWPRVRARALRAPVFLGSLQHQPGRCAPPAHRSFAASYSPPKLNKSIELGPPTSWAFFFPLDHRTSPAPCPAHHSFTASYSTQKLNKIYRTGAAHVMGFFLSTFADPSTNIVGSKLCTDATIGLNFFRFLFLSSYRFLFFLLFSYYSLSSYFSFLIF